MDSTRELITIFHEINQKGNGSLADRRVARFTPALVGMIGTALMFDTLLAEFDAALTSGAISDKLRTRVQNLAGTFIPQVAALNSIEQIPENVTPDQLRTISSESPQGRKEGVKVILGALMTILREVRQVGSVA